MARRNSSSNSSSSLQGLAALAALLPQEEPTTAPTGVVEETTTTSTSEVVVEETATKVAALPTEVTVEFEGLTLTYPVTCTLDPQVTCEEWETPRQKWGRLEKGDIYFSVDGRDWNRTSLEYLSRRIEETALFRLECHMKKWKRFFVKDLEFAYKLQILPLLREGFEQYFSKAGERHHQVHRSYMLWLLGEGEKPSFPRPEGEWEVLFGREKQEAVQTDTNPTNRQGVHICGGGAKWSWSHYDTVEEEQFGRSGYSTHFMWVPRGLTRWDLKDWIKDEGVWIPLLFLEE